MSMPEDFSMHPDPFPHTSHIDPHSLPFYPLPSSSSSTNDNEVTLLHLGYIHSVRGIWSDDAWDTNTERREKKRHEKYSLPIFSAVIKRSNGDVWVWDLGLRDDLHCLPKAVQGFGKALGGTELPAHAQLSTLLKDQGISVNSIKGLIVSHCHLDHYGRWTDFPPSVPVYLGSGSLKWVNGGDEVEGGLGSFPSHYLHDGRKIIEIGAPNDPEHNWESKKTQIGTYDEAWDLFGDKTVFAVKAEGHCPGHLSLLVRTSSSPDAWVLLSADAAHTQKLYLPIPPKPYSHDTDRRSVPAKFKLSAKETEWGCMQEFPHLTWTTLSRMTRMEAQENVMVILGHESEFATMLRLKPGDTVGLNGWKEKGLKEKKDQEGERITKGLDAL